MPAPTKKPSHAASDGGIWVIADDFYSGLFNQIEFRVISRWSFASGSGGISMLIYHPAFDINHARLRIIQLVEGAERIDLPFDLVRILDFYFLFPHLLGDVQLTRGVTRQKRMLAARANKYNRVPAPRVLIYQMEGIQETAVRSLEAIGLVELPVVNASIIRRSAVPLPDELARVIGDQPSDERELAKLLATEVAKIPLTGPNGLKARTGLLEYRYDPE